jgi:hypothetical protein
MGTNFKGLMNIMVKESETKKEKREAEKLEAQFEFSLDSTEAMLSHLKDSKVPTGAAVAGSLCGLLTELMLKSPNNKVFLGTLVMGLSAALLNVESLESEEEDTFFTDVESDFFH